MAKATAKTAAKTTTKAKPAAKKTSASTSASATDLIEKVNEAALAQLQSLGIDQQLQSDIYWCLGSYRHDKNPTGLYEMAERALAVFNAEKAKKTKGIPAKLITDIEKALKAKG